MAVDRGWRVDQLDVRDLRCWSRASLTLPPGLVVLCGPNGAGKTSLVEAIVMATMGASPRTSQIADLVHHGAVACHIRARVSGPEPTVDPCLREIGYQPRVGRRLARDGVAVRSLAAWRAPGSVLVFVPEELRAVKGPPAARRRGMDRVLEALHPGFSEALSTYAAALTQRNALLRRARSDGRPVDAEAARPWETQMAEAGAQIVTGRRAGVDHLREPFARWLEELGGAAGGVVRWEASPQALADVAVDGYAAAFAAYLADNRPRDTGAGTTLGGPHRDDLWIGADTHDIRRLGSQGEQRTAALALLLSYRELLQQRVAQPILLLDDVLSELDPRRRRALIEAVADTGQTIITTADSPDDVRTRLPAATIVRIPEDIDAAT